MKEPEFSGAIEKLRDQEVDVFEDAFRELIREKHPGAVMFGLKTRGANRGYQEKQQIEHFGAAGIKIVIEDPEKETENDRSIHDKNKTDD